MVLRTLDRSENVTNGFLHYLNPRIHLHMLYMTTGVMPGLGDNKLAGRKGCIAFVQSPKVCVVAITSGNNA